MRTQRVAESLSWHCSCSSPLDSQVFGLARSCTRVTVPDVAHARRGVLKSEKFEPCPRGAIKLTHAAFVFKKELMATSLGSRESKQAPRFPVVFLAALEELLADEAQPAFYGIMAWWLLFQSWGHCVSQTTVDWSQAAFASKQEL